MKRFRFRLSTLERVRHRDLQAAEGRLAEAVQLVSQVGDAVQDRREALTAFDAARPVEAGTDGSRGATPNVPTGKDWKRWADLRDRQREVLSREKNTAREAEERLEAVRREYREASRNHRLMIRLREKRHRRWQQERDAEETRFLSEIHLQRPAGRRREESGD